MSPSEKISTDTRGVPIAPTTYRSMIDSLLYLTSRPNFFFNVGICARYQSNPKDSYLKLAKRIIIYVNETLDLGI